MDHQVRSAEVACLQACRAGSDSSVALAHASDGDKTWLRMAVTLGTEVAKWKFRLADYVVELNFKRGSRASLSMLIKSALCMHH